MARKRFSILCLAAAVCLGLLAWSRWSARERQPLSPLYLAGVRAAEGGDLAAAEAAFQRVILANPADARAHAELGNVYLQRGQTAPAIQALETASFLRPDLPHVYCRLAQAYVEARLPDEARPALETALRNAPKCPHAHAVRGEQLIRDDNLTGALGEFRETMRLAPEFVLSYEKAGYLLLELGRLAEAEETVQKGLRLAPGHPGLHYLLARVYERRPQDASARARAEEHYRKALPGHASPAAIHAALGRLASQRGDFAAARKEWETALQANRYQPEALYGLAELATREGRTGDARVYRSRFYQVQQFSRQLAELRTQADARPDDTALALKIARLSTEAGFTKEAEHQLDRVIERAPDLGAARRLRARLWLNEGRAADARREFEIAGRLAEKLPE